MIESYIYFDLLEPLNYRESIPYHGDTIDVSVYKDDNNNFELTLNCMKSNGDTIDYYEIEVGLKNYSKDIITINLSDIQMYTEDCILMSDKFTDKLMIVEANSSKYNKVESVTVSDSLRYYIRFLFDNKTASYESDLNEKQADLVITNILILKNNKQINIPIFYFKE
jgi:hypothetical protein